MRRVARIVVEQEVIEGKAPEGSLTIAQIIERLKKLPEQDKFLGIYLYGHNKLFYATRIETPEFEQIL